MCVEIVGTATILGRWQRRGESATAVRRQTGGRSVPISGRAIAVLLGLPRWDRLGSPDAARVLNRHVRPLRAALTKLLRRPVAFFGRDCLVAEGIPVAWVSQAVAANGATLVEQIVCDAPPPLDDLAAALAAAAGATIAPAEPVLGTAPPEEDEAGFTASRDADVPIGVACALVRHDGARIVGARLRGDVQGPLDALGDALAGVPLEENAVRAALAGASAAPGFFLHGVRDPSVFVELVLETREAALAALRDKYATLAALRARRDAAEGALGFDDDEHEARGAAFGALAARFPGALRELEALSASTLAARAQAVELERARGGPVDTPWIRAVLDFHGTLAATLAAKRRLSAGTRPPSHGDALTIGLAHDHALRIDRPPRGRLLDLVWDELSARHGVPRAALEIMVFGPRRG